MITQTQLSRIGDSSHLRQQEALQFETSPSCWKQIFYHLIVKGFFENYHQW